MGPVAWSDWSVAAASRPDEEAPVPGDAGEAASEPWPSLPAEVAFVRRTDLFDAASVPPGLLRAHRVAEGVWGRLVVEAGTVVFVAEVTGDRRSLPAGASIVIPPAVPHHVEPDAEARFAVEFYR